MRKLLALALITALGLFFIGCESDEEQALEDAEAALDEMAEAMEDAAEEAAASMDEVTASMGIGGELTDEDLAAIYAEVFFDDSDSDEALALYEKMGTDEETVEETFEDLEDQPERIMAVSALVHAIDEEKGGYFDEDFDVE